MEENREAAGMGSATGPGGEATEATAVEEAGDIIRRVVNGIRDTIAVSTVYGDPVEAQGVTVIPVARTYFGFGAGAGIGRESTEGSGGGGGGGGGAVVPIGFIEITAAGARWVPIVRPWQRIAMIALPPLIGLLAGRALRRPRLRRAKEE